MASNGPGAGPTPLEQACDAFLNGLAVEEGLSARTVEAYAYDLRSFREYLAEHGVEGFDQIDRERLSGFLGHLHDRGLAASSRARMLVTVRRLLREAQRMGEIEESSLEVLRASRQIRTLPRILRPEETLALIEAARTPDALGLRDVAMLETLYGAGLRVSELVGLPLSGLDRRAQILRIVGKGRKERVVPLGAAASEAIEAYLEGGRVALLAGRPDRSHALFLSRRGNAMTRQNFFDRLRGHARRAGIPVDRVSPHVLRHAFATDLLGGGADLRAIQSMLGHADLSTTEIYTHVSRSKLRETVEARHPRGAGSGRR